MQAISLSKLSIDRIEYSIYLFSENLGDYSVPYMIIGDVPDLYPLDSSSASFMNQDKT